MINKLFLLIASFLCSVVFAQPIEGTYVFQRDSLPMRLEINKIGENKYLFMIDRKNLKNYKEFSDRYLGVFTFKNNKIVIDYTNNTSPSLILKYNRKNKDIKAYAEIRYITGKRGRDEFYSGIYRKVAENPRPILKGIIEENSHIQTDSVYLFVPTQSKYFTLYALPGMEKGKKRIFLPKNTPIRMLDVVVPTKNTENEYVFSEIYLENKKYYGWLTDIENNGSVIDYYKRER
ncbi:hypothetical protein [Ornithobacterium rhinotracheale]|uniref:hypothetical protein n=1 Tax=Ornithobacterium rhinotracheale TaxID=28251 RepID=UPI00403699CD